ncbi:MAG: hypothetical protein ACREQ9_12345 [Candidatus Binatia bacterium]
MNTPTHAALNVLLLGRRRGAPRGAIALAAILPDLPIFGFFLVQVYAFGEDPWGRIWSEVYFRSHWQHLFDALHSIPLFLCVGAWFTWRRSRSGQLVAASLLLHSLVDWPTHIEDAHAYLWPFWREPLPGIVSYWHPGSPVWMLEVAIVATAVAWLARERYAPLGARGRAQSP